MAKTDLLTALENTQSLLAAMLHEVRPVAEIEDQMIENRRAIDENEIVLLREAFKRADYYIARLYDAYKGRVVRDLDEACSAWEIVKASVILVEKSAGAMRER